MADPSTGSPQTPLAPVVQRRLVVWDPSGAPVVTVAPLVTRAQISDLYAGAVAEPFICEDPFDPDFKYNGLSMVEVMVRKQVAQAAKSGDAETVMDRLAGRPKQTTESTKLTLTYEDQIKEIERKEKLKQQGASQTTPITVEATVETVRSEDEDIFG